MSVRNFIPSDGSLWSIRANDISGNYDQAIDLDPSSNFSFSRNGSTIATLGSTLITPSSASLYNGLNVSGTYFSNSVSAIQIPADTSANRPAGQSGYVRYNTGENIIEYWNNNSSILAWIPISEPSPVFTNISPSYVSEDASSVLYTITGSNFNAFSTVLFVGNIDSVEYPVSSSTFVNSSTITCNITSTIADASNNTYFSIKITNSNTGFTTTSGFIVSFNPGPFWNTAASAVLGSGVSGTSYIVATSPFTDLSASDVGNLHTPVTYYATTSPLNGSATSVTLDASSGKLVGTMPSPTVTTNYGFSAYAKDSLLALSPNRSFFFTVTPPALTFVSGTALPSPTYVDSGGSPAAGPVAGGFIIYTFTAIASYGFTINKTSSSVQYLIIAGGGGGGPGYQAGGGGAGGVLQSTSLTLVSSSNYTVVVGAGGAGGNNGGINPSSVKGSNGSNSSLTGGAISLTSIGGGGGASYNNGTTTGNGLAGGSGGGAGATNASESGGSGTPGPPLQGYAGGGASGYLPPYCGGGGGGAGAVGSIGGGSNLIGDGGIGITSSVTGVSTNYAGGGGGGSYQLGSSSRVANRSAVNSGSAQPGTGGQYGGGYGALGASTITAATAGTPNTGGGGGGGALSTFSDPGASGGSGIVVIRFPSYS
jgi:hypothetical protein